MAAQHDHDVINRIANLESQLAFQDDTIETLNQLVTQQADQLHNLQRKMQLMSEKFQQLQERGDSDGLKPEDEIPPHY